MAKLVRLDDMTYTDLVSLTGRLMSETGKPFTLGLTIRLALIIADDVLKTFPDAWEGLVKEIKKREFDPEEIASSLDKIFESIHKSAGPVA